MERDIWEYEVANIANSSESAVRLAGRFIFNFKRKCQKDHLLSY